CCLGFSFFIVNQGITAAAIILIGLISLPLVYLIVTKPKAGIIILLIAAYFIMWFSHMITDYPWGTVIDIIQLLLIIGFFIRQKKFPNWGIFRNSISYIILIWVSYNILQIFNPIAESR